MVWRFLKFWISWTGDIKWCCKSKFRQFRVGFSMCRSHQGSAACSKVRWPILTKYLPDFLKGHSRDTLCLGTDISCWIWLVGFCSLNISAAFTLSPPAIGLKACQAGWAGTSAAQLSDLLRNYSVGQWHFTGWIVFFNHVKVLLGCLYVSYKHILASWSINTTFHRFSL